MYRRISYTARKVLTCRAAPYDFDTKYLIVTTTIQSCQVIVKSVSPNYN